MKTTAAAISINYQIGFFAQLNWCLWIAAVCATRKQDLYLRLTSTNYARPGDNWLSYYFLLPTPPQDTEWQEIEHLRELSFAAPPLEPARQAAHDLFVKNFIVRPEITDYVTRFAAKNFGCSRVLGLHYRGKDKHIEAPAVAWPDMVAAVEETLATSGPYDLIYVASDEPKFVDYVRKALPDIKIVSHPDLEIDDDPLPRHDRAVGDPYRKGFEALVNCLLLARTDYLVKTCSALSGWSAIMNPDLPVLMLNQPYEQCRRFPDSVL